MLKVITLGLLRSRYFGQYEKIGIVTHDLPYENVAKQNNSN